jgi:hypothetical protein
MRPFCFLHFPPSFPDCRRLIANSSYIFGVEHRVCQSYAPLTACLRLQPRMGSCRSIRSLSGLGALNSAGTCCQHRLPLGALQGGHCVFLKI